MALKEKKKKIEISTRIFDVKNQIANLISFRHIYTFSNIYIIIK